MLLAQPLNDLALACQLLSSVFIPSSIVFKATSCTAEMNRN